MTPAMRRIFATLSAILLLCSQLYSSELTSEIVPLGSAPPDEVEAVLQSVLGPQGTYKFLPKTRKVLITDQPDKLVEAMEMIRLLQVNKRNVRIDLQFQGAGGNSNSGIAFGREINGRVVPDNRIRIGGPYDSRVTINPYSQRHSTSSNSSQFLIVSDGGTASLAVVREIAQPTYIRNYVLAYLRDNQLNVASYSSIEDFEWRSVGTKLLVRPTVEGEMITVEIIPEISVVVLDENQRNLTGSPVSIDLKTLATVVTLRDGASVNIGGFAKGDRNFNREFFGGSESLGYSSTGSFTLRASLQ